jgi:hypothetical protein
MICWFERGNHLDGLVLSQDHGGLDVHLTDTKGVGTGDLLNTFTYHGNVARAGKDNISEDLVVLEPGCVFQPKQVPPCGLDVVAFEDPRA